jgi:hypothetical protein
MTQRLRNHAGASTDAHYIDSLTQHDGYIMAQCFFTKHLKCELGQTLAHCSNSIRERNIDAPSAKYVAQHTCRLPGD